ncbi:MAG: DUF3027 domain-containing protein, partial [Brachybacterium alimentarium]
MTQPTTATRRPRAARPRLDAIAADAVELAREALLEVTEPGQVGEYLRAEATGDRLVTHVFDCTMPGYRGWSWVVVVSRASRAKAATVAETALLPGDDAILAPEWEPWSERLKPEDVGADDLLPFREQDERLEEGYEATGDEDADRVAQWELGLGRARVLSPQGRAEAAERWIDGEFGPRQTSGRGRRGTVSATCMSCGFLSQLSGSLRGEFGVCTNEWSPADGRVVHLGFGCGAHSETGQEESDREIPRSGGVVIDELEVDFQKRSEGESSADRANDPAAQSPETSEKPAEAAASEAVGTTDVAKAAESDKAAGPGQAAESDKAAEPGQAAESSTAGEPGKTAEPDNAAESAGSAEAAG